MWTIDDTDSTWQSDLAACRPCVGCRTPTRPEWLQDGRLCPACVRSVEDWTEQQAREAGLELEEEAA